MRRLDVEPVEEGAWLIGRAPFHFHIEVPLPILPDLARALLSRQTWSCRFQRNGVEFRLLWLDPVLEVGARGGAEEIRVELVLGDEERVELGRALFRALRGEEK